MSTPDGAYTRAAALRAYGLDLPGSEPLFDALVEQAARICGAPVALAGFLSDDRELIKSSFGWHVPELSLSASFARSLEGERKCVVVQSTTTDGRFAEHPLVTGPPHVRFFVGAPIVGDDGRYLGCLTVLDRVSRVLAPQQIEMVAALGTQIARELALRRDRIELDDEVHRLSDLLEENEARFRDFFEHTDDFVLSIAPDGTLLHANEPLLQALGENEGLTRTPLLRIIHPEAREAFREALAEAFERGEPHYVETVFMTAGGRRIIVEGTLRPRVVAGRAALARVIFRDITERKEFETELGSARDAALEAARLKTQFLTNVSHEIRTPMNGIVGMLELLLASGLGTEQADFAHQARASAEQLQSIVNNILYVSTLEAGRLTSSLSDFDLYRTLQRIVEVMQVAALGKDLTLSFVIDPALPPIVRGNRTRLAQIVTNLLENAIKFTERGSVSLKVFEQTETATHRVIRFEVRDTGIGIAAEDRLLLFERFSQVEAGSTRRYEGVGLGLAAARRLVETMGGLIDVESIPGEGSLFWFSIPFPKQAGGRTPIPSSDLDLKGKRVLLADHLPTSRRIIRHYLEVTWEMRVDTAETAEEMLAVLRREAAGGDPIAAVIFDAPPDRRAEEFARAVRAEPSIATTGLIYLPGVTVSVNEETMRNCGISAWAAQPVGQGELFDALSIAFAHDAATKPRAASLGPVSPMHQPPPDPTPEQRARTRVLLAEDNFLNRKLTLSQLEKLGYPASAVTNGKEAIEESARGDYSVILMDCQMPIVDGYDATLEIRKAEKGDRRHYIIALTANAREGDREKCLAAGMDDYLAKPTKQEDLAAVMARFFVK